MSSMIPSARRVKVRETADAIRARFAALGLTAGVPPHITPEAQAIDRAIVAWMRCPGCRKRSMACLPFTSADGAYRILAECATPGCGCGEEV